MVPQVPPHLAIYVANQDPSLYTAIDHASWRFILKISRQFFANHAHQKYLDGLRETGISTERVPLVSEMSECLNRFGWRAVPVCGFIPPAAFMEFLSLGILPIACDMRRLEHLSYTPAPDIVHEAAGHAPIIADPGYARYLKQYGEIARKAIYSKQDLEVYEAVRRLSDLKEDSRTSPAEIDAAQRQLDEANARVDYVSEAAQLTRMGWWTIEYGLLGDAKHPKIYGAGLLSSVSESFHCLDSQVRKIPLTVDCVEQGFDITKPQPQLFIAPNFEALTRALDDLSNRMAFRMGGLPGLERARIASTVTTAELDSGVQVSGVLEKIRTASGEVAYLSYTGPCQLAYRDTELDGQGPELHREGYGTPVGRIKELNKSPAELTDSELVALGFRAGAKATLEFESGVTVRGVLVRTVRGDGRNLVCVFDDCTVTWNGETLFKPEWGTYDMACGAKVASVYGNAADRGAYLAATGGFKQAPGQPKSNLTPENRDLNDLYQQLRDLREQGARSWGEAQWKKLVQLHAVLDSRFPSDWLLRLEVLELIRMHEDSGLTSQVEPLKAVIPSRLKTISQQSRDHAELISRGLEAIA